MKSRYYSIPTAYAARLSQLPQMHRCALAGFRGHVCQGRLEWHHPFQRKYCVKVILPICKHGHDNLDKLTNAYCTYVAIEWYGIEMLAECIPKRDWHRERDIHRARALSENWTSQKNFIN